MLPTARPRTSMCPISSRDRLKKTRAGDPNEKYKETAYKHALSEASRFDANLERFIPLSTLTLSAVFSYGIQNSDARVFLAMPIIVQLAVSYMLSIAYAEISAWLIALELEFELFGKQAETLGFASKVRKYLGGGMSLNSIHPTSLFSTQMFFVVVFFDIYCVFNGWKEVCTWNGFLSTFYVLVVACMMIVPMVIGAISADRLRKEYLNLQSKYQGNLRLRETEGIRSGEC